MPEEQPFKTENPQTRSEIAETLAVAAEEIESGTVQLSGPEQEREVTVPEEPTLEVELERLTDSETGEQRYELEYEISWSE
ncbi:amphi-Trp domain-containing protein [Halorientalis regularis]|uniref:Amphi-Trp domain-containing protein n=1 Tax=Halorientalis regularis TaxID=660518 RepID=A0A1G7FGC4_9EURY|nr:amphi-Trp domain-containing protein [Halorientalis regularis]SDE74939.1 amphi-Trp domain-containing protein [Halorientalis regularis]